MPNRILKESITTSENIDKLSAFQETVFYRLIVTCDDFGRADARPKLLASKLFPLKDIRPAQIEDALRGLTSAELVITYTVGGKPFLQMKTWDRHQQVRNKVSKFPSPEDADEEPLQAIDSNCNQLKSIDSKCPRNPIQSNPIQSLSESNMRAGAQESAASVFVHFAREQEDVELGDALANFAQMRKTIRKPLTANAARLILKKLEGFPREQWVQIVNQSVMNSWQGLFPLDEKKGGQNASDKSGVSKRVQESNAQCQPHGVISDGMLAAARQMLEEENL